MTGNGRCGAVLVAGSANIDFVVRAPHIPAPGETVLGGDLSLVPGGKGANQAVACARAGADTTMLAALGDDPFAPILEASLAGAGVRLLAIRSDRATGAALITVSEDAENAITVAAGANATLVRGDLPDLAGFDCLLLQLETPIATVTAFAQAAHDAGVRVVLNAAPAQMLGRDLLATVDVLVVNEAELAVVAGTAGTIAERMRGLDLPCVVATLGGRGACALDRDGFLFQPAFAVTPVDTTAAGDTFCGVLAAGLAKGDALRDALRAAAAAGALATTRAGAQTSVPERADILALLATDGDLPRSPGELADYCGSTA